MIDPNNICYKCMTPLPEDGKFCLHCGTPRDTLRNETNQLPIGSILAGKYLVGCALGQGGFGVTYIGWELNLDRKLAIKEFYPEGFVSRDQTTQCTVVPLAGDRGTFFQRGREKFVEEARTLTKFTEDPGVVSVYDFFNENGTAYIVMDYVEGKTLKQLAEEAGGRMAADDVMRYLLPVMSSLEKVHAAGLLHRDISPDNIMVREDGHAVLLDFGAARQISAMGEHSNTINVKHGFAPEEQYRTHGDQGPWTDVYALCATIYRLTTGVTPPQSMDRVMSDLPLTPPNDLGANLTPPQQAAVMKGLSIRGRERQQSMRELINGLKAATVPKAEEPSGKTAWMGADAPLAGADGRGTGIGGKLNRKLLIAAGIGVLVVGGAVAAILAIGGKKDKDQPTVAEALDQPAATQSAVQEATPQPEQMQPEQTQEPETATQANDVTAADMATLGLKYENIEGGIGIAEYTGTAQSVRIPSSVDGVPVVAIAQWAFFDLDTLTDVTIPGSVVSIGEDAFSLCDALTDVTIEAGVKRIEASAFGMCDTLANVSIPDSVEYIGAEAFLYDKALSAVTLPSGLTEIGIQAFSGCELLANITIPNGVKKIGVGAFSGTAWMEAQSGEWITLGNNALHVYNGSAAQVVVPSGYDNIDLNSTYSVKQVVLPEGMTQINDGAFASCYSLFSVTIPSSVTSIGSGAFSYCGKLTDLVLPEGVTSIGAEAFEACDGFTSFTFPSGITVLENRVLQNCENLEEVVIPAGVTSIGEWVFYGCDSLTSVSIPQTVTSIGDCAFYNCASLKKIVIPDSVITLGSSMFYDCKQLTSVTIPASVIEIGWSAFDGCPKVTIRCARGSAAEAYAKEENLEYSIVF